MTCLHFSFNNISIPSLLQQRLMVANSQYNIPTEIKQSAFVLGKFVYIC